MKHPVYETIKSPSNWPGGVNNLMPAQIARRGTWTALPDIPGSHLSALHAIETTPTVTSSATILNPLDPGSVDDIPRTEYGASWLTRPGATRIGATRAGRR